MDGEAGCVVACLGPGAACARATRCRPAPPALPRDPGLPSGARSATPPRPLPPAQRPGSNDETAAAVACLPWVSGLVQQVAQAAGILWVPNLQWSEPYRECSYSQKLQSSSGRSGRREFLHPCCAAEVLELAWPPPGCVAASNYMCNGVGDAGASSQQNVMVVINTAATSLADALLSTECCGPGWPGGQARQAQLGHSFLRCVSCLVYAGAASLLLGLDACISESRVLCCLPKSCRPDACHHVMLANG
jgi:hypothetical protein